ncbi:MAG: hypothetical protein GF401_17285 [Chitinivibrionales bacterium]|nr:hypothetical protein [Chitinivibrionales bacterium]
MVSNSHPVSLNEKNFSELDSVLDYCDRFLASEGKGSVVYARMKDLRKVWNQTNSR